MTDRGDRDDFAPKIVYRRKPGSAEPPAAPRPPLPGSPPARSSSEPPRAPIPPSPPNPTPSWRGFTEPERVARTGSFDIDLPGGGGTSPVPRHRPEAHPSGRGLGVWIMAVIQVAIAAGLAWWLMELFFARGWEIEKSFDVEEELQAAVTGLNVLITLAVAGVCGFALSALGVLSLSRIGWRLAVAWAALLTLTGVGAAYGLPALVWLLAPPTRSRFAGVREGAV